MPASDTVQIAAILAELNGAIEDCVVQVSKDITDNLVEQTPKDTGLAAANWIPTTGEPSGFIPDVAEAKAAQEEGIAELDSYKLTDGPVKITNAAPHINPLNDGSSTQAPKGFIQTAILKAVNALR